METKLLRMKELIKVLNEASKAYYQENREIMSNFEYDALYDELLALENETNTVFSDSPSIHVGYEILSELPKEAHESPMLSLDKTKDVDALVQWIDTQSGLLSWKLDGLTIVLTYRDGLLYKAVTRGNGAVGEVITNNAKMFKNIPHKIPYKGELILRGEAVIKYSDFENINALIENPDDKYKNPRNLCSGSVRQLNNEITKQRNVHFFAFSLVKAENVDFMNSRKFQMEWLKQQGFDVVEFFVVNKDNIKEIVSYFSEKIVHNDFPSDGLVLTLDDIAYSKSLGMTAKFPRDSIAFKWADDLRETRFKYIEWSASRTGLINPVAVFEPVELEGTTVSRASVHNVSIVKSLELGEGDTILVYKANMIIPQIAENQTRSNTVMIPKQCPVCGEKTIIRKQNDVEELFCNNANCPAKTIKSFALFASRDAINVEGLSEATLEKFVDMGYIKTYADLFRLQRYKDEIVSMDGFGEKSYENLIKAIDDARKTDIAHLLYSLGIPNIGLSNAKLISKFYNDNLEQIRNASVEDLLEIPRIGQVIAETFVQFFEKEDNNKVLDDLLKELVIEQTQKQETIEAIQGKIFVITGSVEHFQNRNAMKAFIEERGGKVTGSVSAKTNFLINNDITSNSSKNKKAKELGVEIITEADLLKMINE